MLVEIRTNINFHHAQKLYSVTDKQVKFANKRGVYSGHILGCYTGSTSDILIIQG